MGASQPHRCCSCSAERFRRAASKVTPWRRNASQTEGGEPMACRKRSTSVVSPGVTVGSPSRWGWSIDWTMAAARPLTCPGRETSPWSNTTPCAEAKRSRFPTAPFFFPREVGERVEARSASPGSRSPGQGYGFGFGSATWVRHELGREPHGVCSYRTQANPACGEVLHPARDLPRQGGRVGFRSGHKRQSHLLDSLLLSVTQAQDPLRACRGLLWVLPGLAAVD